MVLCAIAIVLRRMAVFFINTRQVGESAFEKRVLNSPLI